MRDMRGAHGGCAGEPMPHADRTRTASGRPRADRAAQFMPFAALRGYYDLVRAQERVAEPRHELTEERALALSQTFEQIKRGSLVRVTYYDRDAYATVTGCVSNVDEALRTLTVIRTVIALDDIWELAIVG